MDSLEISQRLDALTAKMRERDDGGRAMLEMRADACRMPRATVWLHWSDKAIDIDASTAERALWVASDYLAIDGAARALQWLDEPEWVEASWSEPGGIPNGVLHAAGLRQEAAQLWCAEHPEAVAAERAARREATYRAYMAGAETAFASSRRRA